jgi:hypothetical protein
MKRTVNTVSRAIAGALSVAAVAAIGAFAVPAEAQISPPPVEVIATLTPVYHEGHANYWYNGYWHYRTGNSWAYYHAEPAFLHERRVRVVYRHY